MSAIKSIGRLRSELEKLIEAQARKMTDKSQASAYKASLYDEVIGGIMVSVVRVRLKV